MKTTIEEKNGANHTIVWHKDVDIDIANSEGWYDCYGFYICIDQNGDVVATALPPLPRNPTDDDAKLMHLYVACELNVACEDFDVSYEDNPNKSIATLIYFNREITHAINKQGEKVQVAIINSKKTKGEKGDE